MPEDQIIQKLLEPDMAVLVIGGTIAVVAIVFSTLTGMIKSIARERTRREIAAYIAEGTMTPDQGERLIKAGQKVS
ncbi:MAG: hypothetical protein H6811_03410 [Phycisphaeraceae bacterium]|nr:hypothetical protein [Phycisphaeraceae bacterium]